MNFNNRDVFPKSEEEILASRIAQYVPVLSNVKRFARELTISEAIDRIWDAEKALKLKSENTLTAEQKSFIEEIKARVEMQPNKEKIEGKAKENEPDVSLQNSSGVREIFKKFNEPKTARSQADYAMEVGIVSAEENATILKLADMEKEIEKIENAYIDGLTSKTVELISKSIIDANHWSFREQLENTNRFSSIDTDKIKTEFKKKYDELKV